MGPGTELGSGEHAPWVVVSCPGSRTRACRASKDPCGQAGGDRGEGDVLGQGVMGPAGVSAEGHSWVRG